MPTQAYPDRLAQLQQMQQSLQQPQQVQSVPNYLNGKVVDSMDAVKATDIPMDGSMYYFPKADGTEVYVKRWLPNGTTEIIIYKPELNNSQNEQGNSSDNGSKIILPDEFTEDIMKRFDNIESRFDRLEKSITPRPVNKAKKEESE
jgi:hypothetical protein